MSEEDEEILEPFGSLAECINYYTDILACLSDAFDRGILTKKEFKQKKKFVMKQYDANLKVVKKKDSHSRKEDIKSLKKPFKSLNKIENKLQISDQPQEKRYQIEDKKGQAIEGQIDIDELS